jgi:hypothetical protein
MKFQSASSILVSMTEKMISVQISFKQNKNALSKNLIVSISILKLIL